MKLTLTTTKEVQETKEIDIVFPLYLKTDAAFGKKEYHYIREADEPSTLYPFKRDEITRYEQGDYGVFSFRCDQAGLADIISKSVEIEESEYNYAIQRAIDTLQGMMVNTMDVRRVG
jgi:hypothetical protein